MQYMHACSCCLFACACACHQIHVHIAADMRIHLYIHPTTSNNNRRPPPRHHPHKTRVAHRAGAREAPALRHAIGGKGLPERSNGCCEARDRIDTTCVFSCRTKHGPELDAHHQQCERHRSTRAQCHTARNANLQTAPQQVMEGWGRTHPARERWKVQRPQERVKLVATRASGCVGGASEWRGGGKVVLDITY
jgi:hypothetical protein